LDGTDAVREQIIAAARFIFERDGFHQARIVNIASATKVGVGTFYRVFGSKTDVFCAVIASTFDEIYVASATRAIRPDNPAAHIDLANRRFLQQYQRHAKLHSLLEQLAPIDEQCRDLYLTGRARAVERIAHSIAELQSVGRASPDIDAHQSARLLVSMTNNYAHLRYTLREPVDDEVAVKTLNRLWVDGLGIR